MNLYRVFSLFLCCCLLLLTTNIATAQLDKRYQAIYSGIPWFDQNGNTVSAHGANIIKDNDRYYLFGERHSDTSNAFAGINCYSSTDLYNWKFESIALPLQPSGKLGPNRLGERPKVMKCPATGEYIMYLHVDSINYKDQFTGYATASNITGPYIFKGPLLYDNKPIKKWDMGSFQDTDGSGYILLHGGDIYTLNADYKSIKEQVCKAFEHGFESPTLMHKDSLYYFIGSQLTGWERNDNYYFTSTSLSGPWTRRGWLAPEGTLTWNSQCTFVMPMYGSKETTYMYMGDRWSFPRQASAATYIWQPLQVSGYQISMPAFKEAWNFDLPTGRVSDVKIIGQSINANDEQVTYTGNWQRDTLAVITSNERGAALSVRAKATQIGWYGLARPDGGYASIQIKNSKGKIVLTSTIDMYSKYPVTLLKFMSPVLPKDQYSITVTVLDEGWWWKEKSGRLSGSLGTNVSFDRLVIIP